MDHAAYIDVLREHGASLAAVARSAPPDAPVPSCPPWTLHDLVGHLGIHHRWVAGNLDRAPDQGMFSPANIEAAPDGTAAGDWLDAGVEMLAAKLVAVGPAATCWTFARPAVSGFWARRTAHETVMHGWDGHNAAGSAEPIAAALAVDGVDEYLEVVPLRFWAPTPRGNGEAIQIRSVDEPADWHIALDPAGMHVTHELGQSDVTVRGDASSVLLYLLGRQPADVVEIEGNTKVLDDWREVAKF